VECGENKIYSRAKTDPRVGPPGWLIEPEDTRKGWDRNMKKKGGR